MVVTILQGHAPDVLATMQPASVQCCVTSIPYWQLRDYDTEPQVWPNPDGTPLCADGAHKWEHAARLPQSGGVLPASAKQATHRGNNGAGFVQHSDSCERCGAWRGEWGQEPTPELYVAHTVEVFRGVWRVLRKDGVLWLNIGDTYWNDPGGQNGSEGWVGNKAKEANRQMGRRQRSTGARHEYLKRKDLVGVPWLVAFGLQRAGWYLRMDSIWAKPNPMPESTTDRPTRAHEYVFLLSKSGDYFYDPFAVMEPVTGGSHALGHGINPKAQLAQLDLFAPGQDSTNMGRLHRAPAPAAAKVPSGWDTGPGSHRQLRGRYDHGVGGSMDPQSGATIGAKGILLKQDALGKRTYSGFNGRWRDKQNASFSSAASGLVEQRNMRSVWNITLAGFKGAHFATFPPALVERCLKAGTSSYGCCPKCRAPWRRVIARAPSANGTTNGKWAAAHPQAGARRMAENTAGARANGGAHNNPFPPRVTIGWQPTCRCYDARYRAELARSRSTRKRWQQDRANRWWKRARRRPGGAEWAVARCIALDICGGSGTVGEVADQLGLDVTLIELKAEYAQMARERVMASNGAMFTTVDLVHGGECDSAGEAVSEAAG